jgi:hypothetical protein
MRRASFRMRLRTGFMLVAVLAIPLSFANNAIRRFQFCWQQQAMFAEHEQSAWTMASRPPKNRPDHAEESAIACGRRKWQYLWEALRFWEPYELIESEPYNR